MLEQERPAAQVAKTSFVAHLEQGIILQVHVKRVEARHDPRHEQGRVEAGGQAPGAGRGTTHARGRPSGGGHLVHQHVQHVGRQAHLLHEVQRLHRIRQWLLLLLCLQRQVVSQSVKYICSSLLDV